MIDECANFSKICFVAAAEYTSCGLKSSSKKRGVYIVRTTSYITAFKIIQVKPIVLQRNLLKLSEISPPELVALVIFGAEYKSFPRPYSAQ